MHRSFASLWLALWLAPLRASAIDVPTADAPVTLDVHVQVAIEGGMNASNVAWLREHVARANNLFAQSGIVLQARFSQLADGAPRDLRTRDDRHALSTHLSDEPVIHVFVVQSLKDVDIKNKWISGVHWRPRGLPGKHFVILSRKARPWTLSHELGHFFGNKHSETINNVMCYEHDGERDPFFDPTQRHRIAERLRYFLRTRELVPLSAP